MTPTLEKVSFKTRSNVVEADYVAASDKLNDWLMQQPGFSYRTVVREEDGTWHDLVYWADLANAQAASAAFKSVPAAGAVMEMIDQDTIQMAHLPLLTFAKPAAAQAA
ncbi:hypothetical protein [Halovulum sp. GXIMD14793]